jgi:topoisomerase-4 subunit A
MCDLGNNDEIVSMFVFTPKTSYLIANNQGTGFLVDETHLIAQTKMGRKIMNVAADEKTMFCRKVTGNMIALVGDNRKILVFKMEEIPTIARGHGVCLQKYKDGGLSDMQIFNEEDGFSYSRSGGTGVEKDLLTWLGHRAQVGKLAPFGFPKHNKFFK